MRAEPYGIDGGHVKGGVLFLPVGNDPHFRNYTKPELHPYFDFVNREYNKRKPDLALIQKLLDNPVTCPFRIEYTKNLSDLTRRYFVHRYEDSSWAWWDGDHFYPGPGEIDESDVPTILEALERKRFVISKDPLYPEVQQKLDQILFDHIFGMREFSKDVQPEILINHRYRVKNGYVEDTNTGEYVDLTRVSNHPKPKSRRKTNDTVLTRVSNHPKPKTLRETIDLVLRELGV